MHRWKNRWVMGWRSPHSARFPLVLLAGLGQIPWVMGWRNTHPAWFPLVLLAGLGQIPWGWGSTEGWQCQATPSPPLGTSQLPPDNPRWDTIMPSGCECPCTVKSEILTGLAQGDHGRVPTHQGKGKLSQRVASSTPGRDNGLWQGHPACGNSSRGEEGWGCRDPASAWV